MTPIQRATVVPCVEAVLADELLCADTRLTERMIRDSQKKKNNGMIRRNDIQGYS